MDTVVIIGGSHAGAEACAALRASGFDGRIDLVCEEQHLPYHRPPLSKAYLKTGAVAQLLQPEQFYASQSITVHLGTSAVAIDPRDRRVITSDRNTLAFDNLIYATGSRARRLPIDGGDAGNVHVVKTHDDGARLADALTSSGDVVVIGAGFIGLEVAASAASRGASVTVIDTAPQLMGRTASIEIASAVQRLHEAQGIQFLLGAGLKQFHLDGKTVRVAELDDGTRLNCDSVVVGIGVVANDELAREAGLATDAGVVVDASLKTSAPYIYAVGDCARFPTPFADEPVRLESVQNATDQARAVAKAITGGPAAYKAVPWFWSDQGDVKLQMAGIWRDTADTLVRGDPQSGNASAFHYVGDRLAGVETINRPADYMLARRLIEAGKSPDRAHITDTEFDLKTYLRR
ncbi:MAG: FAD-dependent oxidoreductase [Pseudomonadota bacterium]